MAEKKYIDRDALINDFESDLIIRMFHSLNGNPKPRTMDIADVIKKIEEFPTEDVGYIRHGYWINTTEAEEIDEYATYKCSLCGYNYMVDAGLKPQDEYIYFCNCCGAKMSEEKINNDRQ